VEASTVSDRASPVVRGRRLAAELRRLRERAGVTGEEAAERLGWSASKISRIETHRSGVKQADLRHLLDLYQVTGPHRDELLALARESTQKSRLEINTASFPAQHAEYLHAELEAQSVWDWEPQVVPGLLQTPEYARAVMHGWESMFSLPPGETERRVHARLDRQQLLIRDPPLQLSVVMDESVLHRKFGDASVMFEQLQQIIHRSELPNVEVRILALSDFHPIWAGSFLYFKFAQVHEVPMQDIVAIEHLAGNFFIEDEAETHQFRVAFEQLIAKSLGPARSRTLIARTSRELWA
jgi:transcriptional regulator with XRE-family HTH domain